MSMADINNTEMSQRGASAIIVRSYNGSNAYYSSDILFPWDIVQDDRRADTRYPFDSQVWMISDDLDECKFLGSTISVSPSGVQFKVDSSGGFALQPGGEILVMLDDPENNNRQICNRPVILKIIWMDTITDINNNNTIIGAEFVSKHYHRCINPDRNTRSNFPADCTDSEIPDKQMDVIVNRLLDCLLPGIHIVVDDKDLSGRYKNRISNYLNY